MPALEAAEGARRSGKWLAGYFSYEAGYLLEPKLRPLLPEDRRAPLVCLGVFDGPSQSATFRAFAAPPTNGPIFERPRGMVVRGLQEALRPRAPAPARRRLLPGEPDLSDPCAMDGRAAAAFDALTARQPVKYGALVSLGGPVVLSRSPELFFEIDDDGWIETHPMKGTAPRGKTLAEDTALREFLRNDPKNQAENRMIVDLLRNDISLISARSARSTCRNCSASRPIRPSTRW